MLVSAVAAAAGIMIAQYMGQKNGREVSRGFFVNLFLAVLLAAVFTGICIAFPGQIMRVYTKDAVTRRIASGYLGIIAFSYIPIAVSTLLSTLLRCMEAASLPLYASIFGAVVNTGLNYVLIFGKPGFPELGVTGAALATVISQTACFLLTMVLFYAVSHWNSYFPAMLYLNDKAKYPVQVIMRDIIIESDMSQAGDMSGMANVAATNYKYAVIIISIVPILMVYPFIQKYFTKGVMVGAVKG